MTGFAPLVFALAILALPSRAAARRLAILRPNARRWRAGPWPRPGTAAVLLTAAVLGFALAGVGGAIAATMLAGTVWRRSRASRGARTRLAATASITAALGGFVVELRAGAHPASAAAGAAEDAGALAAAALTAVAATATLGGDVALALQGVAADHPALAGALDQVGAAWRLADRHGVALAEVLDAVRRDLVQRVRFTRQVHARLAGPRASVAVLAALPVLGVLLGELSGARPLHLLCSTTIGQTLLVLGALLICAGLGWSARLTNQAVPT
ncbi:type II secretion system protein [Solihabitans fulvus]|uniref:Type II secretion system protein n=1 Tax=Solihabitans fulvus TaxID=1892852 RepID=A0A5B2XGJ2_9PSEU|nr:type II secretion system F family protein [Solihabitans fulvus]KAA2262274.1 type II secretion system protein [Solihabitans fulvus]